MNEDCFAYNPKVGECMALREAVCDGDDNCPFYKTTPTVSNVSKDSHGSLYYRSTSSGVNFSSKRKKRR